MPGNSRGKETPYAYCYTGCKMPSPPSAKSFKPPEAPNPPESREAPEPPGAATSSSARVSPADLVFPPGFLWGAASSAHQVEGGQHNDWTRWEEGNRSEE